MAKSETLGSLGEKKPCFGYRLDMSLELKWEYKTISRLEMSGNGEMRNHLCRLPTSQSRALGTTTKNSVCWVELVR